jgi:PIN domain nuclease of toxin-antitoxin system
LLFLCEKLSDFSTLKYFLKIDSYILYFLPKKSISKKKPSNYGVYFKDAFCLATCLSPVYAGDLGWAPVDKHWDITIGLIRAMEWCREKETQTG